MSFTKLISLRVPEEIVEIADSLSAKEARSRAQILIRWLREGAYELEAVIEPRGEPGKSRGGQKNRGVSAGVGGSAEVGEGSVAVPSGSGAQVLVADTVAVPAEGFAFLEYVQGEAQRLTGADPNLLAAAPKSPTLKAIETLSHVPGVTTAAKLPPVKACPECGSVGRVHAKGCKRK